MKINFEICDAQIDDIIQIHQIYSQSVLTETASWEYSPPSLGEMQTRFENISKKYPYLVAKKGDVVLGYAYASDYRPRIGYKFCCENSIYIHQEYMGNGIATQLMNALIKRCAAIGLTQMVAIIGDRENHASIALHEKLGFKLIGIMPKVGFKFDKWLDSVIMQYSIE